MAKLISGNEIAKEIRGEMRSQIAEWIRNGHRPPHLTAVLIGNDPASHTYVNNKVKVNIIDSSASHIDTFYINRIHLKGILAKTISKLTKPNFNVPGSR